MTRSAQHTVLVTLYEGRYFVRRPGSKVYAQCRFNNEILTTDPVDHSTKPIWDTELAWDIDTKILGFLRSQRIRLKLLVFTIDGQNRREPVGYVMLDLRTADAEVPAQEKWFQLVNSNQTGPFKPELKLAFNVSPKDGAAGGVLNNQLADKENIRNPPKKKPTEAVVLIEAAVDTGTTRPIARPPSQPPAWQSITNLPVELMEGGFYQVGDGKDQWLFSITIVFAENLPILITNQPSRPQSEYYFYYTLMGIDIMSERFHNLSEPNFSSQRVSIRIHASLDDLRMFLKDLAKIIIYLCRDAQVIGFADVPLKNLVATGAGDAVLIEQVYNVYDPKQELPVSVDGKQPSIGLSMAITREGGPVRGAAPQGAVKEGKEELRDSVVIKASVAKGDREDSKLAEPTEPETYRNVPDTFQPNPSHQFFHGPDRHAPVRQTHHEGPTEPTSTRWHQYRFSIDLRSVRDFHPKAASIYFKYSYQPFGTSSPVITHPILDIFRTTQDVLLPHSFCAFEFVMSPDRLQIYLEALPLVIEMWSKYPQTKDVKLGTATIDLSRVLGMPRVMSSEGSTVIQSIEEYVMVSTAAGEDKRFKKVADLRVVFALEDFGVLEEQDDARGLEDGEPGWAADHPQQQQPRSKRASVVYQSAEPDPAPESSVPDTPGSAAPSIHETAEYKAALQLELWKQEEERKFRDRLVVRENEFMAEFSREWKRRERDREQLMKRKIDEFKALESQMQKLVADLEVREKRLLRGEEDLIRRKEEIGREGERRVEETRDAARRLHDEFRHRMEIERGKAADAEAHRDRALKERDDAEAKRKVLERELVELRQSLSSGTEATLKAELNTVTAVKIQLERKVTALERAKKHYKSEWVQALRALAKAKKGWQADLEERLAREREEVERMKVQVKEKDELDGVQGEMNTLDRLRRELDLLRKTGEGEYGGAKLESALDGAVASEDWLGALVAKLKSGTEPTERFDPQVLNEVERLTRERENLLDTGVYTREDSLVRALDKRIRELLASRNEE
ncbi:hypothetical protein HK097_006298 [Rhizophlyctis rosea]|uniref:C2 domain-containing protein n=1 Tax=Rhizophlyctis rosea TaxID=64517 RepID=A0AAD5X6I1_9FUNG|nr:hypothetical protein HK097_006298 [Rhizophlyctis rosea]